METLKEVKKTKLKQLRKEDIIICLKCRRAYTQEGEKDALTIIKENCPKCGSNKLFWAIDGLIEIEKEKLK